VKGDVEKAISILNKAVEKDKVSISTTFSVLQWELVTSPVWLLMYSWPQIEQLVYAVVYGAGNFSHDHHTRMVLELDHNSIQCMLVALSLEIVSRT
jgi:hypothetical protein